MYTSFIGIFAEPGREDDVGRELASMASVVEVYAMRHPFDIFIKVQAISRKSLEKLACDILRLDGVERDFCMLALRQRPGKQAPGKVTSFVGLRVDVSRESVIENALLAVEGVAELYTMIYPFDLMVKISGESEGDMDRIVNDMLRIEGVKPHDREHGYFPVLRQEKGPAPLPV